MNKTLPSFFRPSFLKDVADFGLDVALDIESVLTDRFTGPYFHEQIQGMADSTGLEVKVLIKFYFHF